MDLTFNTKMEAYYQKFFELQEKLRKSEEERIKLELRFNELVQISKEEEQAHYKKLRSQYKKFLEEDRKRQERNEKIIRTLERIEARVNMLSSKTERIKMLRRQYQSYMQRISQRPTEKREYSSTRIQEEIPAQIPKSGFDYVKKSCDIAMLKKAYGKTNEEKIEILDKYLQSLKSQTDSAQLESKSRETRTDYNDLKYLDEVSKKLNGGFCSNDANSIADDILKSIYARHYKTNLPKDHKKKIGIFTSPRYENGNLDEDELTGFGDHNNYLGSRENREVKTCFPPADRSGEFKRENINMDTAIRNNDTCISKDPDLRMFEDSLMKNNNIHEPRTFQERLYSQKTKENSNEIYKQLNEDELLYGSGKRETDLLDNEKHESDSKINFKVTIPEVNSNISISKETDIAIAGSESIIKEKNLRDATFEQNKSGAEIEETCDVNSDSSMRISNLPIIENIEPPTDSDLNQVVEQASYENKMSNHKIKFIKTINDVINQNKQKTVNEEIGSKSQDYIEEVGASSGSIRDNQDGQSIGSDVSGNQKQLVSDHNVLQLQDGQQIYATDQLYKDDQLNQQNIEQSAYVEHGDTSEAIPCSQPPQDNDETGHYIQQRNSEDNQYDQQDEHGQLLQQYDENGQHLQEYDENCQRYDENGQSTLGYDENGQLIQQYDDHGHPMSQYDEQVEPLSQYDDHGQPIQQYDDQGLPVQQYEEHGQSISQYDAQGHLVQQYADHGQPIQLHDDQGLPVQQYDTQGQPVQQYDEPGEPVQQYDEQGQIIQQYDEQGQIIQQYDEQGQPIQQYEEPDQSVPQYDEHSQLIQQYDEQGQPIQQYDEQGQHIQQYEEHEQSFPQYDEHGQLIQQNDKNGQPIHFSQDGQSAPYADNEETGPVDGYNQQADYNESFQHYDDNGQPVSGYNEAIEPIQEAETLDSVEQQPEVEKTGDGQGENFNEPSKKKNVLDLLDTDSESVMQNTSKVSNDSDFDFSNG